MFDIAIIGGGPAGLSSAVTGAIRKKKIALFEQGEFSAKLQKAHTVDNYVQTGKDIENMIGQIAEINKISSDNSRSVEEIAGAAEHLSKMTENLNNKLGEFRT